MNPHPVTNTYLDDWGVETGLIAVQRVPESHERSYRIPMSGILQLAFPRSEGFSVVAETDTESTRPDLIMFKTWCRPGGTLYSYDHMLVECKNSDHTIKKQNPNSFLSFRAPTMRRKTYTDCCSAVWNFNFTSMKITS